MIIVAGFLTININYTITTHGILRKILYVDFSSGVPAQVERLVRNLIEKIILFSVLLYVPCLVYNLSLRPTNTQCINSNQGKEEKEDVQEKRGWKVYEQT